MKNLFLVTMAVGLVMVTSDDLKVSAQILCTRHLDNNLITMTVVNKTKGAIVVNWVDDKCSEKSSNERTAAGKSFYGGTYNGHVFRAREASTNKLLKEFVVNPGAMTITVTDVGSTPSPATSGTQPASGAGDIRSRLIGTWILESDKTNRIIFGSVSYKVYEKGKLVRTTPYTLLNGNTVEYKNAAGETRRGFVSFENNSRTMILDRPDINQQFRYTRSGRR